MSLPPPIQIRRTATITGRDLLPAALKAFEARKRPIAAAHLRDLDRQAPDLGETWGSVARLAMIIGESELAIGAARRHAALEPSDIARRLALGGLLAQSGQVEAAVADAEELLRRLPAHPSVLHFLGTCYAQLGRKEAAKANLRASIAALPPTQAAWSWLTLADLKTFTVNDPDITALRDAVARVTTANEARSVLLYAFGKALTDIGQDAEGFAAYSEGAQIAAAQRDYDHGPAKHLVDQIVTGMTGDFFRSLPQSRASSARPIFVLGLPRSGSTLVEQILASHSAVTGGAELNLFKTAAMGLPGFAPQDIVKASSAPDAADLWTRIGEDYLHLLGQRFGAEGRIIDKTLNHSRFVGLIRHALPGARFVWLRRDPADSAWSIFRTRFSQGMDWSWSMASIGAYAADEDRLHAHWSAIYPEEILTLRYEDLVAEPEFWMRRLLDHCGLPFEAGVMAFHNTSRVVQTASVAQVRQPLYASSVGGAQRYADYLAPFFDAYRIAQAG